MLSTFRARPFLPRHIDCSLVSAKASATPCHANLAAPASSLLKVRPCSAHVPALNRRNRALPFFERRSIREFQVSPTGPRFQGQEFSLNAFLRGTASLSPLKEARLAWREECALVSRVKPPRVVTRLMDLPQWLCGGFPEMYTQHYAKIPVNRTAPSHTPPDHPTYCLSVFRERIEDATNGVEIIAVSWSFSWAKPG